MYPLAYIFHTIYLLGLCHAFSVGRWKNNVCVQTVPLLAPSSTSSLSSTKSQTSSTEFSITNNEAISRSIRSSLCSNDTNILVQIDEILESFIVASNMTAIRYDIQQRIEECYRSDLDFCSDFANERRRNDSTKIFQNEKYIPHYELVKVPSCKMKSNEQVVMDEHSFLAIRTIGEPIIDKSSIETIINAAESTWNIRYNDDNQQTTDSSKSRFTYQRRGNYEAHTIDLAKSVDNNIFTIINNALRHRIYPMVRDAFHNVIPDIDDIEFCVYDSLIIRYNSTEAILEFTDIDSNNNTNIQFTGAGQPLHRDLGLVSVNIMFNSDNFEGGGTFFEDQMYESMNVKESGCTIYPLQPSGVGQAVAHLSSKRHAGAGTTTGVRDIMVIFLSARKINVSNGWVGIPKIEKAARLKSKAREYAKDCKNEQESILHRIISHRLALDAIPNDGEAWHYFGMAIHDLIKIQDQATIDDKTAKKLLELCILCLKRAMILTPCDGRLSNNIGLCTETLQDYLNNNNIVEGTDFVIHSKETQEEILYHYERSKFLHDISKIYCDVHFDLDMTCLNKGLYLSKQDRFQDAADVLSCFDEHNVRRAKSSNLEHMRIQYDGGRLLQFCQSRC